ncbi:MAG: hypothetical protein Q4D29_12080, partial [Lachnospiraceae bacterium]|nr:hypothetical protein [Lachnospiraceae bacterium]
IVAYFFREFTVSPEDGSEVRCYSISYNQGESWSIPKDCQGDLKNAGLGYMSGSIQYLGGKYHYVTGERLFPCEENDYSAGKLKWYSGTKDELLNGALEYIDCIYSMQISEDTDFYWPVLCSDFGNVGACVWKNNIFVACGSLNNPNTIKPLSTQQQKLFNISTKKKDDEEDLWSNPDWKQKMDEAIVEEDTDSWDYYFYSEKKQNMFDEQLIRTPNNEECGCGITLDEYVIDLGNNDYDIEVSCVMNNLADNLFIGVQHPDNSCDGIGRVSINCFGFNSGIDTFTAMLPCGLNSSTAPSYMILSKRGNEYTASVNGTTVKNWKYHWNNSVSPTVKTNGTESFIMSQHGFRDWLLNASDWSINNELFGLKMCRIRINH